MSVDGAEISICEVGIGFEAISQGGDARNNRTSAGSRVAAGVSRRKLLRVRKSQGQTRFFAIGSSAMDCSRFRRLVKSRCDIVECLRGIIFLAGT